MSIRLKLLGFTGLVFFITTAITIAATLTLVQGEYAKIEADNVSKDADRAVDAIGNRIDQLALKIADWSSWDDTYQFIQDHNQAYLESNVQDEALQSLSIDFILFYNAKQQLVAFKGVNLDTGEEIPIPPELQTALLPGSQLLARDETSKQQGILATSTYPLIVTSRAILRTDNTGPQRGTLVFAEYLDPIAVTQLGELTHLHLTLESALGPGGALSSTALKSSTTAAHTQTTGANTIVGSRLIKGIYGRPILLAKVTEPRNIYQETRRTLTFYLVVILVVGLIGLFIVNFAVNLIVRKDRVIQLKNEFFSIASHELRTPLTAIRGNSVMLKQVYGPKNDPEHTAITDDIHEASVRLIKIVNDFLDLARLERGQMPLNTADIQLSDPVGIVVQELQTMAAEKGLYVKAKLPARLPLIKADAERIQQVIYNLAGNAMKFTAQGGVTVGARAHRRHLVVLVTDTGRGMSPAQQNKLFKSFQQTRDQDATLGSGLGLYISKLLVERMGGKIWVEWSEEGKGTTIAFSLPRARAPRRT